MFTDTPQILLLLCNNCRGMAKKLLPEINLQFSENVQVMPITCPAQIDPFVAIKLLKTSVDGVIVACPKEACCCPANQKIIKRREIVKDILPVFGLHKEQFQVASISPFGGKELAALIEQMVAFLKTIVPEADGYPIEIDENLSDYKWVN